MPGEGGNLLVERIAGTVFLGVFLPLITILMISGCSNAVESEIPQIKTAASLTSTIDLQITSEPTSQEIIATADHIYSTPTPSQVDQLPAIGPEYVPGFHPLTGLPVNNPASMRRNPLLVSITNFPPSARPQAGLSLAAQVWETSIGQGMTRFLALYYGDYLSALRAVEAAQPTDDGYDYVLGPVRSGRIAYEEIKRLFPDSKLIIRYASYQVVPRLSNIVVVDPVDPEDVNSAGLSLEDLEKLTQNTVNPADYAGMMFDPAPPANGQPGQEVEIVYNVLNRVAWKFDQDRETYLRYQSEAFEGGELVPAVDRLTGEQLAFENIVILFAKHSFENLAASILDIDLSYVSNHYGFLLRDGQLYPVKWSTTHQRLALKTYDGQNVPFKPGRTFIEVVSYETSYDKELRVFRFHNPKLPTFTPVTPVSATPSLTITGTSIATEGVPRTPSPTSNETATNSPTPSATPTSTPSPSSTADS